MKNRRRRQAKRRQYIRRLVNIERSIVLQDPISQAALTAVKRRLTRAGATWGEYHTASRRRYLRPRANGHRPPWYRHEHDE